MVPRLRHPRSQVPEQTSSSNRGWTAAETGQVLAEVAELGMQFLEEPNDAAEHLGRRWLTSRSPIPIAADESAPDLAAAARELVTSGADLLAVKTARTGLTESSRIVGLAEGLGVELYVGNQIDTQVGTAASVAFGAAFEATSRRAAELSNFLDMSDDLMAEPLEIVEGVVRTREVPGVGNAVDEDKWAHYRTTREKQYSQQLQREGKWPEIWRVVGEYANYSVFDVESHDELHTLLQGLPLFPYMNITVTALATHPSDVKA